MNRNLVGCIYGGPLNGPIRNKNCLWRPCLLMDRDEMSNRCRGTPIDASYKDSVHLAKQFQRRFLKIGQSETRIAGPHCSFRPDLLTNMAAIGDSCFWLADFKNSSPLKLVVNGAERHKQAQQRTFHRCFLPSFGTFGQPVSEEKNF
jgi:hypothetical protein